LRLRLDPQGNPIGFEPGMTVWMVNVGAMHSAE
jgi:hypothetical protein